MNVKGKGNEAGNYKSNSYYKCITRGKGNSTAENGYFKAIDLMLFF